jgi:hypothetical protein
MAEARECDPGDHSAHASESVQVTSDHVPHLSLNARGQGASDEGQFRAQARRVLHIGERLHLALIDIEAASPEIAPRRPRDRHPVMHDRARLIEHPVPSVGDSVRDIHVIVVIRLEAAELLQDRAPG